MLWSRVFSRKQDNAGHKAIPASTVTETKRWATDINEWGKREGSKEATIQGVEIRNRFGQKAARIRCGEPLTVRVRFTAREPIKDFHFGIAIFREDGVYCYGPNTKFDGIRLPTMGKGEGSFELRVKKCILMPGLYFLSAAIWDEQETFAYDYHKCRYTLEVEGASGSGALVALESRWKGHSPRLHADPVFVPADLLVDCWGERKECAGARVRAVTLLNRYNQKEATFTTGSELKIKLDIETAVPDRGGATYLVWAGLYRSDKVLCHACSKGILPGDDTPILLYPQLVLLPGEYRVSVGIWDTAFRQFTAYIHGVHAFNMISEKLDHGTVYLAHRWKWQVPQ